MEDHRFIVSSAVARDLREMFGGDFDLLFIESPAIPEYAAPRDVTLRVLTEETEWMTARR